MPPKRKAAAAVAPATATLGRKRASALAKQHNLGAREESEIYEAWTLFAEPAPESSRDPDARKNGVMPTTEVRSALAALGIPPSSRAEQAEFIEVLDPDGEGFARYEDFFAVCALKYHARGDDEADERREREAEEAFALFTASKPGDLADKGRGKGKAPAADVITLGDLKRVAALLKEEVSDEVLRDMILEANGGAGVGAGVAREEFADVMRRAGVFKS